MGLISQKRFVELISIVRNYDPPELSMKFAIPYRKVFDSILQSEVILVDWRRFIGVSCLQECRLSSDQMWSKLNSLRNLVSKQDRRTLIGTCLPFEEVKECIFGEESEQARDSHHFKTILTSDFSPLPPPQTKIDTPFGKLIGY